MNNAIRLTILFAAPWFCGVTVAQPARQSENAPSFVNEATLNAPVAAVWKVWTTSEGFKFVGVALADVDFRIGGLIRSRYSSKGVLGDEETIENRILAYEPQRMIAIRIERPPKSFPFREAWKSTWTVVTLSDLGNNRTHIRVASMGYGTDEESMAMRRFFESGNAWTLKTLQSHFQSNPTPKVAP
jgi:uncharacterized protein YndB with AHSA1/START domain